MTMCGKPPNFKSLLTTLKTTHEYRTRGHGFIQEHGFQTLDEIRTIDPKLAELIGKFEASIKEMTDYVMSRTEGKT